MTNEMEGGKKRKGKCEREKKRDQRRVNDECVQRPLT